MEKSQRKKVCIVGGGAVGYFVAANLSPKKYDVIILERAKQGLQKVKISGGGRCNVTHACFDPRELVQFYPRGHKELLSVFTKFQPGDTMAWFEERGVALKIEADNRIFPTSDSSESVMHVLREAAAENQVTVMTKAGVTALVREPTHWTIRTKQESYSADIVVFCTGSSPKAYDLLRHLNLKLVDLVPSLFTFNSQHQLLDGFMGTAFPDAEVRIPALKTEESGPLLITHWGLSGPAILKLSAWCARELFAMSYQFKIVVNFIGIPQETAHEELAAYRQAHPKKSLVQTKLFGLTHRFWKHLLKVAALDRQKQLANLSKKDMQLLLDTLCQAEFTVNGKSTFKDEFVTAGGVALKEIDFRTMRAKTLPDFYLAGEVLNIDAVTGGFNFQACWSEAWLIAQDLNKRDGV